MDEFVGASASDVSLHACALLSESQPATGQRLALHMFSALHMLVSKVLSPESRSDASFHMRRAFAVRGKERAREMCLCMRVVSR